MSRHQPKERALSLSQQHLDLLLGPIEEVFLLPTAPLEALVAELHQPVPRAPLESVAPAAQVSALFEYGRRMAAEGRVTHLAFDGPLVSGATTPFSLDGERYESLESMYHSLKLPEGSPERAACAAAPAWQARRLTRRMRTETFTYRERPMRVGSPEHAGLIARAVAAKVEQQGRVQEALQATGRALLVIRTSHQGAPLNVLGRVTPIALMIERWRRWG